MIANETLICYNIWPLFADHILDLSKEYYRSYGVERLHDTDFFIPENVKDGEFVFVKTDYVVDGTFMRDYYPRIRNKFNLITANSSYQIGAIGSDGYKLMLEEDKLLKWYSTNPPEVHNAKIVPIPIGFEEPNRVGGNQMLLNSARSRGVYFWNKKFKALLPYHNFSTNPEREGIYKRIASLPFVDAITQKQNIIEYLNSINDYRFVICLAGSGLDLHRIPETLLMGSIPILINSVLKRLFSFYDLPGIFVNSWSDLDDVFLEFYKSYPSGFEAKFQNVGKFLMAENYKKLFAEGAW